MGGIVEKLQGPVQKGNKDAQEQDFGPKVKKQKERVIWDPRQLNRFT